MQHILHPRDTKFSFGRHFAGQDHLFQPVQVVLIDLELKAFLEASALRHLHVHRTHVLLVLLLLLLPQIPKVTKRQLPRLFSLKKETFI